MSRRLRVILCICVLSAPMHAEAASITQDEIKAKVAQAVALYLKDAGGAYNMLRSLGTSAIPYIVEAIKDDSDRTPLGTLKKGRTNPFLVDVIAGMRGEESDAALIELLAFDDAIVRGAAVSSLGQRKTEAAIPYLVMLLEDKSPYMSYMVNHPSGSDSLTADVTVLVRDVAIEALQNITGVNRACKANKDVQAKAWLRWWQDKQQSKQSRR